MHVRIVTVQIRSDKASGLVDIFRNALLPELRRQPGFRGARLLTDAESGRAVMETSWDTQADLQTTEASGWFREQLARFQPVLSAPPDTARYEVSVLE